MSAEELKVRKGSDKNAPAPYRSSILISRQDWLKSEESQSSGWSKDDGSGETVGHDSGRNIIAIQEKNPSKDAGKYDDDDIAHMRKVVSYCKRHLAQEEKAKKNPDSKSYKSLKNWGHDPLKT